MAQDTLNSLRALREDLRQRLLQMPEYRALVSMDRTIAEVCEILQNPAAGAAFESEAKTVLAKASTQERERVLERDEPVMQTPVMQAPPPAKATVVPESVRQNAIASAFVDSLNAKLEQGGAPRPSITPYLPTHHAVAG